MADASIRAVITAEDRASRELSKFGDHLGKIGQTALVLGKRLAIAGGAALAVGSVIGVKTAAQLESARMGFVTLLGSAEKADATMTRIKREAMRTPFEVPGLTAATQLLTAVTKDGDKAVDIVLDVGEGLAAMGRGQEELDRISVNLQQIAASGRAFGIDIKQFAFAGIPIFEMLQEETGLAGEALAKFIEQGGVTFDLLTQMFDKATQEGGRFFGAYKNQLGTFNQSWSNLKDAFQLAAAEILVNTGLFNLLKQAMLGVGNWISTNRESIVGFFTWLGSTAKNFINALKSAWDFLKPAIERVWNVLKQSLIPELTRLWKVIKPVVPIIGIVLVGALRVAIEALAIVARGVSVLLRAINGIIGAVKSAAHWVVDRFRAIRNAYDTYIAPIANAIARVFSFLTAPIRGIGGLVGKLFGKRQHGGPIQAGKPYIVGEAGPELVVPGQSGTVVPNDKLGSASGASNINFNVNIGLFAGTKMERRQIAKILFRDFQDVARQFGLSPTALLDSTNGSRIR